MIKTICKAAACAALITQLVGCGTVPSTIAVPVTTPPATGTADEQRYKVSAAADAKSVATVGGRVLPLERSYEGVLAQVRAHQIVWQTEADNLADTVDRFGNTTFAGALIGGAGVLAKSTDVGRVGAAIAGGSGLWRDHYALATQAENYRLAADAAQCMYVAVYSLPKEFWDSMYDANGLPKVHSAYFVENVPDNLKQEAEDGYAKLATMFQRLHSSMHRVREKLAARQRTVTLATPSADEIAGALQKRTEEDQEGQKVTKALANSRQELQRVEPNAAEIAAVQLTPSQLKAFKGKNADADAYAAQVKIAKEQRAALLRLRADRIQGLMGLTANQLTTLEATPALREQYLRLAFDLPGAAETCEKKIGG